MPWQHALKLVEKLSGNPVLTLIKNGDHRLSTPEDIDLIAHTLDAILAAGTRSEPLTFLSPDAGSRKRAPSALDFARRPGSTVPMRKRSLAVFIVFGALVPAVAGAQGIGLFTGRQRLSKLRRRNRYQSLRRVREGARVARSGRRHAGRPLRGARADRAGRTRRSGHAPRHARPAQRCRHADGTRQAARRSRQRLAARVAAGERRGRALRGAEAHAARSRIVDRSRARPRRADELGRCRAGPLERAHVRCERSPKCSCCARPPARRKATGSATNSTSTRRWRSTRPIPRPSSSAAS